MNLFFKMHKNDMILVEFYVDDIIFGLLMISCVVDLLS